MAAGNRRLALSARVDALVAGATAVYVGASDSGVLSDDVDGLVTELESLRQALEVTDKIGQVPLSTLQASKGLGHSAVTCR